MFRKFKRLTIITIILIIFVCFWQYQNRARKFILARNMLQLERLNQKYTECTEILRTGGELKGDLLKVIDPDILFVVNSKTNDYKSRCAIRFTWGHHSGKTYGNKKYMVVFNSAKSLYYNSTSQIFENSIYNDLFIYENIKDTYSYSSLKSIAAWKRIYENFNSVKYIIKTDSDVFVNMERYMKHILSIWDSNIQYEGLV